METGASVLDFGAHHGAISTDLAARGHDVTAVSPGLGPLDGVTVIAERMTPARIRQLGTFDYVLALSVLPHQHDWRATWDALKSRARRALFVETPAPGEDVPSPEGLVEAFAGFPHLCVSPGFRDGFLRTIVKVDR